MITGLYNGTLFIIDNEDIGASHIRPNLNPSNWFRNKYGLIIASPSNIQLGLYGMDLGVALENVNNCVPPASDVSLEAGILVNENGIYLIAAMADDATKHFTQLKKPTTKELHIPILSPITDLECQLEFVHATRAVAVITEGLPDKAPPTLDEYIQKAYKRSLAGRTYGEVGNLFKITVDDLKTCLQLAKEKKYSEINKFWKMEALSKIEIKPVKLDQLENFCWASLEML